MPSTTSPDQPAVPVVSLRRKLQERRAKLGMRIGDPGFALELHAELMGEALTALARLEVEIRDDSPASRAESHIEVAGVWENLAKTAGRLARLARQRAKSTTAIRAA
jgi:hypothetical protein